MPEAKKDRLGYFAKDAEEAKARDKARRLEVAARNDALLANADFSEFLREVARRGGLMRPQFKSGDDWNDGYRAALKDLVCYVVTQSSRGPKWLAEYVAAMADKDGTTEKERINE